MDNNSVTKIRTWCIEIEVILDDIRNEIGEADNLKRNIEIMPPEKAT